MCQSISQTNLLTMLISLSIYFEMGWKLHGNKLEFSFLSYVFVRGQNNVLISNAKHVFDDMLEKNVVMYMITRLLRFGMIRDARGLFYDMWEEGIKFWITLIIGYT